MTAPTIAEWSAQAACLAPTPFWYGRLRTSIPDPIIAAMEPIMALNENK